MREEQRGRVGEGGREREREREKRQDGEEGEGEEEGREGRRDREGEQETESRRENKKTSSSCFWQYTLALFLPRNGPTIFFYMYHPTLQKQGWKSLGARIQQIFIQLHVHFTRCLFKPPVLCLFLFYPAEPNKYDTSTSHPCCCHSGIFRNVLLLTHWKEVYLCSWTSISLARLTRRFTSGM